ncbi:hypothetical protein LCGC14_3077260, partial [marine sediment metagenome]
EGVCIARKNAGGVKASYGIARAIRHLLPVFEAIDGERVKLAKDNAKRDRKGELLFTEDKTGYELTGATITEIRVGLARGTALTIHDNALATVEDTINTILGYTGDLYGNQALWLTATGFAVPGNKMDLVDVPNATAVTAIQAGLAKASALATVDSKIVTMYGAVLLIQARTNMIGAVSVEYTSPADSTGAFTIFCGDDYLAADSRALTATVTGYAGPDLTNATAKFRLLAADTYQTDTAAVKEADYEIAASIAVSGTTVTFSVDVPRATTLLLSPTPPDLASNYRWQFVVTTAGGEVLRAVTGTLTARKGIGGAT